MAVNSLFPVPLFDETSLGVDGNIFVLAPSQVAIIRAFGFEYYADRVDNTEARKPQSACMEMILFKEGNKLPGTSECGGYIIDLKRYVGEVMAIEQVRINNCSIGINKCNNLLLWNVPGAYRFVMNDQTAIGEARIYVQFITKTEFPWDSDLFI